MNIYSVGIVHYNLEMAAEVRRVFLEVQPDCVAVELPETMELKILHAASRLPDISVVIGYDDEDEPVYTLAEPSEGTFEALRSGLESGIPCHCIDLDVPDYPEHFDLMPDPYSITKIGHDKYFEAYKAPPPCPEDEKRELYMAKRLKELSLRYDKVLFVCGMAHLKRILELTKRKSFPVMPPFKREDIDLCTLTEESCREVMAECGWMTVQYEEHRHLDRQHALLHLYKEAARNYIEETKAPFPGYHLRNLMKFARNYSLVKGRLMPNLIQLINVAKGIVDHNYAYEVWELATTYPYRQNIDGLMELDLTPEDLWGEGEIIQFHLRERGKKSFFEQRKKRKDRTNFCFDPPGPFSICSFQPEDVVIENFGDFLMKKGTQLMQEEGACSVPFTTSLEDGVDTRETIRHWLEKKLYVKVSGKPPGGVGSVVVIFDEDGDKPEKYQWRTTWLGEHDQESDMALYATPMGENIVGPGISRCEYGGLMMSYPPRRMYDVWSDADYADCSSKAELLLMAAIDYSVKPLVTYVAAHPPRSIIKSYARRYGKKVVYIPIGQLSPITLNKLRTFHVLDGYERRSIADEYIN